VASTATRTLYVDDVLLEAALTYSTGTTISPLPYFDGSSVDTDQAAYDWTGTVGLSTSVMRGGLWQFPDSSPVTNDPMKSDASLAAYREINQKIVTAPEFSDGYVILVDPSTRWDAATSIYFDKIHPNNTGHQVIYEDLISALNSAAGI